MKWSEILPSRWLQRIIIIVLALGLIIAAIYTVIEKKKTQQAREQQGLQVSFLESEKSQLEQDSDNDGVFDWEERLWGLDPFRADSDSDGVSDKVYIERKKRIQEHQDLGIENLETTLSESQILGRGVYTALLAIEESGNTLDEASSSQISDNIGEYVQNLFIGEKLYLREDFVLVANTKEYSYAYRDAIYRLLQEYPLESKDIQILIAAIENTQAYKTSIANLSNRYDILVNELAKLEVPYAVAGRHTEFVNTIGSIAGALKNLNQDESDELVSLSIIVQMEDILKRVFEASLSLEKFFEIIEDESVFND